MSVSDVCNAPCRSPASCTARPPRHQGLCCCRLPFPATQAYQLSVTPLGAGQEVGRSCIIVKYRGKTVMLDCGIHPGFTGLASLPFLDEVRQRSAPSGAPAGWMPCEWTQRVLLLRLLLLLLLLAAGCSRIY